MCARSTKYNVQFLKVADYDNLETFRVEQSYKLEFQRYARGFGGDEWRSTRGDLNFCKTHSQLEKDQIRCSVREFKILFAQINGEVHSEGELETCERKENRTLNL